MIECDIISVCHITRFLTEVTFCNDLHLINRVLEGDCDGGSQAFVLASYTAKTSL